VTPSRRIQKTLRVFERHDRHASSLPISGVLHRIRDSAVLRSELCRVIRFGTPSPASFPDNLHFAMASGCFVPTASCPLPPALLDGNLPRLRRVSLQAHHPITPSPPHLSSSFALRAPRSELRAPPLPPPSKLGKAASAASAASACTRASNATYYRPSACAKDSRRNLPCIARRAASASVRGQDHQRPHGWPS
jgi:hypothetical protein